MTNDDFPRLLTAKQVAELLNVKISRAYSIIRQLNNELEQKGKLIIRGRISEKYLRQRLDPSYEETGPVKKSK